MTLLALILLGLLIGLIFNLASPALLFLLASLLTYFLNMVSVESLLIGFTNSGLITLVLLLLSAAALEKTELIGFLGKLIGRGSLPKTLARLGFSTAFLSSFTNNTAVVASFIGIIKRNQQHAPEKLLLPLSYAAILGGTLTLIGTSTHLIINSFVENAGLVPLGFFEFSIIGLVIVIAGISLLVILASILPSRTLSDQQIDLPYLLEAKVSANSSLIGSSVLDNHLRALKHLYLVELERDDMIICPVPPELILQDNDILRFSGAIEAVELLHQFDGLEWFGKQQAKGQNLIEAVLAPSSVLVGQSLKRAKFRENFDGAVIAIRRGQSPLNGGLGDIELQAGDVLLISPGETYFDNKQLKQDFAAISGLDFNAKLDKQQSFWVLSSFFCVVSLSLGGVLPLIKGLSLLLLGYLGTRVLSLAEIKRRFPIELVIIVGCALNLASLMLSTGLATLCADYILMLFEGKGAMGAFIGVYLLTLLLTELITNNAAAALAFPIAYAIALNYGVDSRPFILAVIFGASASFISPYGYQTNLMVLTAGNYKFSDYLRLGLPLSVLYSLIVLFMVPIFFPF